MLEIQKYLIGGKTLNSLQCEFGIVAKEHEDGRVILNYDQIESQKSNPIVKECRGLVLDKNNNWEVVARAFDRFFNWGELQSEAGQFDWQSAVAEEKHDGSLILCYRWNGKVCINTRNSFGDGQPSTIFNGTWQDLFWSTGVIREQVEDFFKDRPRDTLVFELCTIYNKVVRTYVKPTAYLLTIRDFNIGSEWTPEEVYIVAASMNAEKPKTYSVRNKHNVETLIQNQNDQTFEGFVIRDKNNNRWKIKSSTYLALHRLKGNGNIILPKNLIPLVLNGEASETLVYFPEVVEEYTKVEQKILWSIDVLEGIWSGVKDIKDKKEFALTIQKRVPNPSFTSFLFRKYKTSEAFIDMLREDDCRLALRLYEGLK